MVDTRDANILNPVREWTAPRPGHWRRDFRLGEWLTAPLTPSCAAWLIPQFEEGYSEACQRSWGIPMQRPAHVIVNGWYYTNIGRVERYSDLLRHPSALARTIKWFHAFATVERNPARAERVIAEPALHDYERWFMPEYRAAVEEADREIPLATPEQLIVIIDTLAQRAGAQLLAVVEALGFASKSERALRRLLAQQLGDRAAVNPQELLAGVVEPSAPPSHAVLSLDWVQPTTGELSARSPVLDPATHAAVVARREQAEAECRANLASSKQLAQFNEFLAIAQRYAAVREAIARDLTLGWPAMRRALQRLGVALTDRGAIGDADDVFFLEHDEVQRTVAHDEPLHSVVAARRAMWEQQRALDAPLTIGKPTGPYKKLDKWIVANRAAVTDAASQPVSGAPASPGRATGPARIVRDIEDFDKVQEGDVLVAPITAPAWTPLFATVVAVVTDGGSLVAHASLIAREFGIPAVVGTRDATRRLEDGMIVTVDGTTGLVEVTPSAGS